MKLSLVLGAVCALALTGSASAQDVKAAEGFLRGLYAGYAPGKRPAEPFGKDVNRLFTPPLTGLMKAYVALEVDGVGDIEIDPICACQDWTNLKVTKVDVTPDGPNKAQATVSFDNAGSKATVRYKLEVVEGKWRIADLSEDGIDGLRAKLASAITDMAKELAK
jgi:opacity protein-like surface antigen